MYFIIPNKQMTEPIGGILKSFYDGGHLDGTFFHEFMSPIDPEARADLLQDVLTDPDVSDQAKNDIKRYIKSTYSIMIPVIEVALQKGYVELGRVLLVTFNGLDEMEFTLKYRPYVSKSPNLVTLPLFLEFGAVAEVFLEKEFIYMTTQEIGERMPMILFALESCAFPNPYWKIHRIQSIKIITRLVELHPHLGRKIFGGVVVEPGVSTLHVLKLIFKDQIQPSYSVSENVLFWIRGGFDAALYLEKIFPFVMLYSHMLDAFPNHRYWDTNIEKAQKGLERFGQSRMMAFLEKTTNIKLFVYGLGLHSDFPVRLISGDRLRTTFKFKDIKRVLVDQIFHHINRIGGQIYQLPTTGYHKYLREVGKDVFEKALRLGALNVWENTQWFPFLPMPLLEKGFLRLKRLSPWNVAEILYNPRMILLFASSDALIAHLLILVVNISVKRTKTIVRFLSESPDADQFSSTAKLMRESITGVPVISKTNRYAGHILVIPIVSGNIPFFSKNMDLVIATHLKIAMQFQNTRLFTYLLKKTKFRRQDYVDIADRAKQTNKPEFIQILVESKRLDSLR